MPPKRMTANPVKPARHRAGKGADSDSDSDSDASDAQAPDDDDQAPSAIPPPPKAASAGRISSNLGKLDLDARRKEAEAAEARRIAKERAERLAAEEGFVTEEEEEESEEDDDDEEESSSEEESSEEEAPRRLMIRPKFIPKSQRGNAKDPEKEEEEARKAEEEARKKEVDQLVEEQIAKDLAARAAGKKHWDDDENSESDVDTTDGLDAAAEEAAWRVRELKRLKRARAAIEAREAELAEVERRRNLTEEERAAEDAEHIQKQQDDKDAKGKVGYMQRYFHKGAFYREEAEAAGLADRDLMHARIADEVQNREVLPEYLQRRDMAKLGRKGASKYKDMRSEDTGRWGGDVGGGRPRREGAFGGDERFQPDDDRFRADDRGVKGANAIPLGDRRDDGRDRGSHRRDGDRERERERDRDRDRGDAGDRRRRDDDDGYRRRPRSYLRSRSPRRDLDRDEHRSRRKRSTSRDGDRYESDKRRRVNA